jgi:hypothetical protein
MVDAFDVFQAYFFKGPSLILIRVPFNMVIYGYLQHAISPFDIQNGRKNLHRPTLDSLVMGR